MEKFSIHKYSDEYECYHSYQEMTVSRKMELIYFYTIDDRDERCRQGVINNEHLSDKIEENIVKYMENNEDLDVNYDLACGSILLIGHGEILSKYGYQWSEEFLKIGIDKNIPKFLYQKALLIYYNNYEYNRKYGYGYDGLRGSIYGEPRELINRACDLLYEPSMIFRFHRYQMTIEECQKWVKQYLDMVFEDDQSVEDRCGRVIEITTDQTSSEVIRYLMKTMDDMVQYSPNGPEFNKAKDHWNMLNNQQITN